MTYSNMFIGVIDKDRKCISKKNFLTITFNNFDNLSEEYIDDYINKDKSYDKTGWFGIQSNEKSIIIRIEGNFYNVVGFPVNDFTKNLTLLLEEQYEKK